jgi:hypothetical protein
VIRLALLALGCSIDPGTPSLLDAECPVVVHHVIAPKSPGHCVHVEATNGASVRQLGSDDCQAWRECLTLGPGETAESGGPLTNPGNIRVLNWPCEQVPQCEGEP